jgi:hypothetical protein
MKKLFFLAVLLCFSALARAEQPTFADIRWGAPQDEVRKQLALKGFTSGALDKDGDVKFEGNLVGHKTKGFALFADGKVAKITVRIITPNNKAIDTYRSMKDVLSKKYGKPSSDYEFFKKPYYDGDGYETQAIRVGKATFSSFWGSALSLEIHESLVVQLNYESEAWEKESDKRKARSTSVF